MGITPNLWGPSAWTLIHLMVLSEEEPFKKERLVYYKDFFNVLTHLLPCEKCRMHLKENLKKIKPLDNIQTKKELFLWTVELHNLVNKITNKRIWNAEEVELYWNNRIAGNIISDYNGIHDIEYISIKKIVIGIAIVSIIAIITGITMMALRKNRRRS